MGIGHKGYSIVPREVAHQIGRLSKISALELAYSLAARLAESADDPQKVYDALRNEWEVVRQYRGDRALPEASVKAEGR